jgi:hypothetical protein
MIDFDRGCTDIEWKVLRHGVTWSDRFMSEERCIVHIHECMEENNEERSEYEYMEMTDEEIRAYTHTKEA